MLLGLLRLIGFGVREKVDAPHVEFDDTWTFSLIKDKHRSGALYLRSYDNLDASCTWVSRLISRSQLEPLVESKVVSLYEDDTGSGE